MPRLRPDPTFYPSPGARGRGAPRRPRLRRPARRRRNGKRDALGVVDTDPESPTYGRLVGQVDMPQGGNELHHFGWNACSSHLCPYAPNAHVERRYLVVPGHALVADPHPRHQARSAAARRW